MLYRCALHAVVLASDDTDYTLHIPSGAKCVRLSLSDTTLDWRFGLDDVSNPLSPHMPVAAGQSPQLTYDAPLVGTTIHLAITGGTGNEVVSMYCVTPMTR